MVLFLYYYSMCKWKFFLTAMAALLFFWGCGSPQQRAPAQDSRIVVLSTIAQIGDLAAYIGGDRIRHQVLVRGELNPHSYELVKGDDEKFQEADVVFYQGLGLEHSASVTAYVKEHPNALAVGDAIFARVPDQILWKDSVVDPHVWMDLALWSEAIDPIAERLSAIDPAGAAGFRARADALKAQMQTVHQQMRKQLQHIPPEKRYLVTSHDAFHYFARSYLAIPEERDWEERFTAPEGLAPDGQLNPIDLKNIVDHLAKYRIEVIFPESNVSRDSIRKIADAGKHLGLRVRICEEVLYGDALQGSYLEAMQHNADVIARGLS